MDITTLIFIGSIVVLILMSGFFSGSETALTAASRAHMHRLENGGNRRAGQVMSLIREQEHVIATVLLGNNLVNILATALATSLFTTIWGDLGVAYATVAMTVLVLVFAEVLPKTYAIGNANRVALAVAPIFRWLVRLLWPLVAAVQWLIGGILHFVKSAEDDLHRPHAREELRGAIDLGTSEGRLHRHEKSMLGGILDLDDVYVGDVMIHRRSMETVNLDQGTEAIVQQVMTSPHTRLPVWQSEQENIIGVLHAKDLLRQVLASPDKDTSDVDIVALLSEPWFVPETNSLREQLNAFRQRRAHFAIVIDEYGVVLGLVTLEDILEEIVGDIHDEHDIERKGYDVLVDGAVVVDGTYPIRDLNRAFDWSLSDAYATTVAGFVIHRAQSIPEVGRTFLFDDFLFQVLERKKHQITRLKITPPDALETGATDTEDDG